MCSAYLKVIEQKEKGLNETLKALRGSAKERKERVAQLKKDSRALREGNDRMQAELKSSQAAIQKMCEESKQALTSACQKIHS